DCRLEAGFLTYIDGDPRRVSVIGCRVTGSLKAVSDAFVHVDSCWFDHGSIFLADDGELHVYNSTFTGPGDYGAIAARGDVNVTVRGNTIRDVSTAIGMTGMFPGGVFEIEGNVIERCTTGIENDGGWSTIVGNHVSRCATGLDVAAGAHVADNVVTDCAVDGIRFHLESEGDGGIVERNIVARSGRNGLFIERPAPSPYGVVTVRNNTSFDNTGSGLVLRL